MNHACKIIRYAVATAAQAAIEVPLEGVRVAVLGGERNFAESLALQLKQNILLSELHVYGEKDGLRIGADVKDIDTK